MHVRLLSNGKLYVHSTDGSIIYTDNIANAELDFGSSIITLPSGMVSVEYDRAAGVLSFYDKHGNCTPRPGTGPCSDLDALLDALPSLIAAQAVRNTPPPPTSEELAAEARSQTDRAERLQAKLDAAVMALVDATPAQLVTYARNNFPSLTLAEQNRLGTMLFILAVAVRPLMR